MPNIKKVEKVKSVGEKIKKSKSLVFVDYQGLAHKQLEELRNLLSPVEGEFEVIKNTLIKIALNKKDLDLAGPTGVLFSYKDEISPLAKLAKFIKTLKVGRIKLGIFGDQLYSEEDMLKLAVLPSKEILLAQVVGGIKAPISGLVYALNGNLQKLVFVLGQIKLN